MKEKLLIIGDSAFAEVAYEYFSYDSPYEVAAFSVEKEFITRGKLFNLPVVPFEDLEAVFSHEEYKVFVAIAYNQLNKVRTRLYKAVKQKNFQVVSYISSRAFVWRNAEIGENCFIFENNVIQPFVKIGNNVVLWSGNHIGHHSVISDNCFISSHVVVSGFVNIAENCFLGVNSCIADNREIARDCIIGMGAVVNRDTEAGKVYTGNPARPTGKDSYVTFNVKEE
jgi:sugar O-acyltransferase (sialic acid O-acetyltransferase NeuD family)